MSTSLGSLKARAARTAKYPQMFFKYFVAHPFAPLLVQVVVTRRCNLKCGYCNEYDRVSAPVPIARLERTIDKLAALHSHAITFTGGEPTLHPDLPQLIAYASARIARVSMVTNGYKLTRELIASFNEAGLGRLQISLDGLEPNDVTTKVYRCTERKLRLLAAHARFAVHINAVLGSIPFQETLQIVRNATGMGFETTVQWLHDEHGRALNPYGIGPGEIERLRMECKVPLYHSRDVLGVGVNVGSTWKCRAGSRYLYIDEFSRARYCSQALDLWECDVDALDERELRAQFYTPKPCSEGCTLGCVRDASQYDRLRRQ